jgi:hypothetical protein
MQQVSLQEVAGYNVDQMNHPHQFRGNKTMSPKNYPVLLLIVLLLIVPVLNACNTGSDSEPDALPTGQTMEVTYTPAPDGGEALVEAVEETGAAEAPAPASIQEFKQALAAALTSGPRDYTALENLMGDSFEIMIWYGNGKQMTPAEAVTALQSAFLPPTNVITYSELTEIDPNALFGGNPFQLYPNAVDFLFSQGWGESGNDEVLIYIGQEQDGTYYWQGVLYANDGFASSPISASEWVPIPTDLCVDLQAAISSEIGLEPGTMEESSEFYDVVTGTSGTSCLITITGTGADGLDSAGTFEQLSALMQSMGWTPDLEHSVAGPTGMGGGFVRDSALLILVVGWEPSDDANCPEDRPIGDCELSPEQKLFTIMASAAMQ